MDERLAEEMKKKADELGVKEGVLIAEVVSVSAAGVLKSDDVIVGIDGKEVHKFTDLQEVLAKNRPGDKVKVKVIRDKKEKEFVLTLKNSQGNTKVVKDAGMELDHDFQACIFRIRRDNQPRLQFGSNQSVQR